MAIQAPYYQRPTDQVADNATITIQTGVDPADPNYAPSKLVDGNPARVAKINSTTAAWQFDFGSAQRIDLVALIHHDFDAGANVRLQANSTPVWTASPAPPFNALITIPPWLASGTKAWPVNPWKDLTGVSGYTQAGYRYWRLVITSNSQNVQLGQIWLSPTIRSFSRAFQLSTGMHRVTNSPVIQARTSFGIRTTYSRGTNIFSFAGTIRATDSFADELREHWHEAGGMAEPWLLIPDRNRNEAYFVNWSTDVQTLDVNLPNLWTDALTVEEVGRGLRPGV